jgi:hypothetical protein
VFPLRGKHLTFRNKIELDWFIEFLTARSQEWCQAEEQNPEEAFFLDLGLSNEHKRSLLRRGLLFGKRKRRR